MKKKIINFINDRVSRNDMMDYTEFELSELLQDVANHIDNKLNTWVTEISDGKYNLWIDNEGEKRSIEVKSWQSKKSFATDLYELFI